VVLALPDLRQEPNDWWCAKVCAHIVWDFFGLPMDARRQVPGTPLDGCPPDALEIVLWESGLSVISGSMDVPDLKYHAQRGRPVILLTTEDDGVGHYVVSGGLVRRSHKGKTTPHLRYQCPLDGPRDEPVEDFEKRWVDRTRRAVKYLRWGIACSA
jgi:hypothetical protein